MIKKIQLYYNYAFVIHKNKKVKLILIIIVHELSRQKEILLVTRFEPKFKIEKM
jgi:hypothetical protein